MGRLATELRTRDRSVLKEGRLLPAIQAGGGQVAPGDLGTVPAVVTFGARAQSLNP